MPRKTVCETSTRLMQKYNALSPMMKILFSADAQLRYAADGDLMPIMDDLLRTDRLSHSLLRYPISNSAQAELLINRAIAKIGRKDQLLNYTTNALTKGDAIVFRMAYSHGQNFTSMNDFNIVHPILTDAPTLQRQIALLKRFDRTLFSMRDPQYSQYYHAWVKTPRGRAFEQRRQNYTLALKSVLAEQGIAYRKIPIPYTGIGREYIREVSRQRS
ncbi:MAG: hypothetical protein IKS41_01580 [Alphaproteobacteria bacterium]|nr:hypothetical protein [Alphaproteobacteria bacterium]